MVSVMTLETSSLGDRSYLVSDGSSAAVIDPQRDIDRMLAVAHEQGVTITDVFETHIHNDYVTGGFELARQTGARYHVAADDEVFFERSPLADGDEVKVGQLIVRALHTPGHTPTHLSYLVMEGDREAGVFTGGSLLYGTVGRTDLVSVSMKETLTRAQYRSAHRLDSELSDGVEIYPTHGFGSFCSSTSPEEGSADADQPSTISDERRVNVALTTADEDDFVQSLLAGLGAYPRYYVHMGPRNRIGPAPVDLSAPIRAEAGEIGERIAAGEWVVDVRDREAFAQGHVVGTINVELGDSFTTYLGWLVPWNLPITLVGDDADAIADAQRQLVRIGIERPTAAAVGGIESYGEGLHRGSYEVTDFAGLLAARDDDGDPFVLDVRRDDERREGAVTGSSHVPIHELERRVDEVPDDRDVWVHCASGYRASVAASLLARGGRRPVLINGEYATAVQLGLTR